MDAYVFQAALLCSDCANVISATSEANPDDREDSDHWPQGPYSNGGGEADSPQHCDHCGIFLENELTPDGDSYVRELSAPFEDTDLSWSEIADKAREAGEDTLANWLIYYFSWGR